MRVNLGEKDTIWICLLFRIVLLNILIKFYIKKTIIVQSYSKTTDAAGEGHPSGTSGHDKIGFQIHLSNKAYMISTSHRSSVTQPSWLPPP